MYKHNLLYSCSITKSITIIIISRFLTTHTYINTEIHVHLFYYLSHPGLQLSHVSNSTWLLVLSGQLTRLSEGSNHCYQAIMEERKATLEAGLLQLKAAEVVDRQSQSQLVSGRMQKDVDVLGSGVGAGSFVRHDIDLDGLTVDCLYRGDAADSEQETSDVDDEPLE